MKSQFIGSPHRFRSVNRRLFGDRVRNWTNESRAQPANFVRNDSGTQILSTVRLISFMGSVFGDNSLKLLFPEIGSLSMHLNPSPTISSLSSFNRPYRVFQFQYSHRTSLFYIHYVSSTRIWTCWICNVCFVYVYSVD